MIQSRLFGLITAGANSRIKDLPELSRRLTSCVAAILPCSCCSQADSLLLTCGGDRLQALSVFIRQEALTVCGTASVRLLGLLLSPRFVIFSVTVPKVSTTCSRPADVYVKVLQREASRGSNAAPCRFGGSCWSSIYYLIDFEFCFFSS